MYKALHGNVPQWFDNIVSLYQEASYLIPESKALISVLNPSLLKDGNGCFKKVPRRAIFNRPSWSIIHFYAFKTKVKLSFSFELISSEQVLYLSENRECLFKNGFIQKCKCATSILSTLLKVSWILSFILFSRLYKCYIIIVLLHICDICMTETETEISTCVLINIFTGYEPFSGWWNTSTAD